MDDLKEICIFILMICVPAIVLGLAIYALQFMESTIPCQDSLTEIKEHKKECMHGAIMKIIQINNKNYIQCECKK